MLRVLSEDSLDRNDLSKPNNASTVYTKCHQLKRVSHRKIATNSYSGNNNQDQPDELWPNAFEKQHKTFIVIEH